ncbi:Hypothetical predicted protein [Cloeon dipterum]|uniref:SH3 domain-containing protein n=1 Tax=Cloeon dipterum TaxID=197152 RepID=A0A8S1BV08_9INSE|nr:Hypothetical predicted protein [Cloeon dipterum]
MKLSSVVKDYLTTVPDELPVSKGDVVQEGDLIFFKGEFIIGTHKIDDNWWHGKCNAMEGMFPKSYVLELEREKNSVRQARVKTSMRAQMDEEIDLVEGDIVTVEKTWDKNYLYGCSQGKYGIFPAAFVTILADEEPEIELRNNAPADMPPAYRESFLPPKYEDSFPQANTTAPSLCNRSHVI